MNIGMGEDARIIKILKITIIQFHPYRSDIAVFMIFKIRHNAGAEVTYSISYEYIVQI